MSLGPGEKARELGESYKRLSAEHDNKKEAALEKTVLCVIAKFFSRSLLETDPN